MTYRVSLKNAATGWAVESQSIETLRGALALKSQWFRQFHGPIIEEWGVRPGLLNLPVTVTITSSSLDIARPLRFSSRSHPAQQPRDEVGSTGGRG